MTSVHPTPASKAANKANKATLEIIYSYYSLFKLEYVLYPGFFEPVTGGTSKENQPLTFTHHDDQTRPNEWIVGGSEALDLLLGADEKSTCWRWGEGNMSRAAESFLIYDIWYNTCILCIYVCMIILCVSSLQISLDLFNHSVQVYSFHTGPSLLSKYLA